jgi:hypothetical protein
MSPEEAVSEMGEFTFAATDLYGPARGENVREFTLGEVGQGSTERPRAVGNKNFPRKPKWSEPSVDVEYKKRVEDLVGLAVYYSACALINVLKKCNVEGKDTLSDRIGYHSEEIVAEFAIVPHKVPQCHADVVEQVSYASSYFRRDKSRDGIPVRLMLMASIMIPVVALLIIPKWISESIIDKKKLVSESDISVAAPAGV